jgi:uncharacterized RDD family membrane protein YckC
MATTPQGTIGAQQYCTECGRAFAPDDLASFGANRVCAECKPRFVQRMQEGGLAGSTVVYGGFWRRGLALFLDAIILAVILFPIEMVIGMFASPVIVPGTTSFNFGILGVIYLISFVVGATYQGYFLSQKGATPGKMVMGLKVVTATGARLTFARAVGRYFATILSGLTFFIGYLIAAFDSQKRALHDHICSTRVIRQV